MVERTPSTRAPLRILKRNEENMILHEHLSGRCRFTAANVNQLVSGGTAVISYSLGCTRQRSTDRVEVRVRYGLPEIRAATISIPRALLQELVCVLHRLVVTQLLFCFVFNVFGAHAGGGKVQQLKPSVFSS